MAASSWKAGTFCPLWHPSEIIIIVGAAFGAFLTSNPPKVVKAAFQGALALPKGPRYKREDYVTLLKLLYDILMKIRKEGVMAIEGGPQGPRQERPLQEIPEDSRQTIT